MLKDILEKVAVPGAEFRGIPFWIWSGRPDTDELRRQLGVFSEMGFGGAIFSSGTGLITPYLSEEWFGLVSACADEAKKLGMKLWIYDEDRWPSGAAGGLVTKDKRFRQRYIRHSVDEEFPAAEDSVELARYAVILNESTIVGCRRIRRGAKLGADEHLMVFNRFISPANESWFNGQNYLDVLNPKAVEKFVDITYEAYRRHLAPEFGKVIPGFFTDEPNLFADSPMDSLPWTDGLETVFESATATTCSTTCPNSTTPAVPISRRGAVSITARIFPKPGSTTGTSSATPSAAPSPGPSPDGAAKIVCR